MIELRLLDGTRLDLTGDEVIAITYAVNDIASIQTRQGVTSNEFELPITDFNLKALGYPTNFNVNQNVNPFKQIPAEIYEEELRIAKGYIQITNPSISGNVIPVTFFGENSEWFNLIKGKSIRDLNLNEYIHKFTPTVIKNSFSNTDTYKYILCDRNGLNFVQKNNIPCQAWTLAVYQSLIAKEIFKQIGFKITGSLLTDPLYKKTLIADTNDKFYALPQGTDRSLSLGTDGTQIVFAGTSELVNFSENDLFANQSELFNSTTNTYTLDTKALVNASSSLSIKNIGTVSTTATVDLLLNGVSVSSASNTVSGGAILFQLSVFLGDVFIVDGLYRQLNENDTIQIQVTTTSADVEIQQSFITALGSGLGNAVTGSFSVKVNNIAIEGGNINPAAVLPDIDQAEFIKEFVFDHNALVSVNLLSKEIRLDLKKYTVDNALEWSNIIDLSENVEINFTEVSSKYYNINDVKRADTDGVFIKEYNSKNAVKYGNGQFNIENDFLEKRGTLFESKFGGTTTINSLNTTQALPYIIGEKISDTININSYQNTGIYIDIEADISDFLEIPINSIWVLVTEETSGSDYNRAYALNAITTTATEYILVVDNDFGTSSIPADGIARLIVRDEEATPRKLIDGGNYSVVQLNDNQTSFDIVAALEPTAYTNSVPYTYFWNPILNKPSDENNLSLSYGNINIPSLSKNLIEQYYQGTIKSIQYGKVLRASFRLNQNDIFNLNFNRLVFLNFYLNGQTIQGYFIINKLEEYTGNADSTVVELIKV